MDMFLACRTVVLSGLFTSVAYSVTYAQINSPKYEIGVGVGTTIYQGDLSTSYLGSFHSLKPAINLFASRSIDQYFAIRANLAFSKVADDESTYSSPSYKRTRNFKFSTTIAELSAQLVWNITGINDNETHKIIPYLYGGAGLASLKIYRDWSKFMRANYSDLSTEKNGLPIDSAHSLPNIIPIIPVGAGLRYAVSPNLSLAGEFNYHFLFTDYLDGFSQAVNPKSKDKYYSISFGIIYSFKKSGIDCPRAIY